MAELSNELNQTLKKIKKLVEEELENDGYTISELEKKFRKTFILDKEQKPKRNEKRRLSLHGQSVHVKSGLPESLPLFLKIPAGQPCHFCTGR